MKSAIGMRAAPDGRRRLGGARVRSDRGDGALNLAGVAHIDGVHLHPERWRRSLDDAELGGAGGYGGIPKDRHSRHARRDFFEEF
jgi:hypothetical protein